MKRNDCRKPRGSVFDNNGYWFVNVRLPGESKRKKHPLCAPGSDRAMRSDRPREMAVEAAHRLWEKATRQQKTSPASTLTVDDLCAAYLRHAVVYYHGETGETATCACACRTWRELHGARPVAELVHTDMLAVRDALVRRGLARVTVNRYIGIIGNRLLPWALDEGLIRGLPFGVGLRAVCLARRGHGAFWAASGAFWAQGREDARVRGARRLLAWMVIAALWDFSVRKV